MPITADTLDALAAQLVGSLAMPGSDDYTLAVRTWNGAVAYAPAVVVRPVSAQDISAAVRFAGAHNLGIVIRSMGHGALGRCGGRYPTYRHVGH